MRQVNRTFEDLALKHRAIVSRCRVLFVLIKEVDFRTREVRLPSRLVRRVIKHKEPHEGCASQDDFDTSRKLVHHGLILTCN